MCVIRASDHHPFRFIAAASSPCFRKAASCGESEWIVPSGPVATTRPASTMISASNFGSSDGRWMDATMVASARASKNDSISAASVDGSNAEVGSSSRLLASAATRARAMATR